MYNKLPTSRTRHSLLTIQYLQKCLLLLVALFFLTLQLQAQFQMEYLTRGVHAVPAGNGKVFVSWRLLGTEDQSLSFNLYKTANGKTTKLNKTPLQTATGYTDEAVDTNAVNVYTVKAIINKKEEKNGTSYTLPAIAKPYVSIALKTPTGYAANDASVGDVDGDGVYEIFIHMTGKQLREA